MMKGYKAFNMGFKCREFQYEIGKTYECEGELKICENGFHFCENLVDVFGYYLCDKDNMCLAEVEAIGDIVQEGTKYCTNKIKIVREVDWAEVEKILNNGVDNSGYYNGGDYNSGNYNSGDYNSGSHNSGEHNSGDCNSGNRNNGDYNNGCYNGGSYNNGSYNSGGYNSGNYNSGWKNSGDRNCGWYNNGNRNSGFFNSDTPTVRLFNKDSGMTFKEFFDLGIDFMNMELSKEIIQNLPNYDAEIFFETTGIDWRENDKTN